MSELENERLKELAVLEILSSASEKNYDQITELVAKICKAKAALISFLDKDIQWIKSSYGINIRQMPIKNSPCAHTILFGELNEVENLCNDERFIDSSLTQLNPPMTFYAGYPIKSVNGNKLGTICILDDKKRELSVLEKKSIEIMANQVAQLLALRTFSLADSKYHKIEKAFLDAAGYNHEISSSVTTLMLSFDLNIKNMPQKFYDKAMDILDKISDRLKDVKVLAQEFVSPHAELADSIQMLESSASKVQVGTRDHYMVLLVEDDEDQREFLSEVLEYKSTKELKITAVEDGQKATQNSLSIKYDIIVTDFDIPKINGIDFIKACRSEGKNLETPIVFTSGGMESVDKDALLANIPNVSILEKPFKIDDLIELMETIFAAQ